MIGKPVIELPNICQAIDIGASVNLQFSGVCVKWLSGGSSLWPPRHRAKMYLQNTVLVKIRQNKTLYTCMCMLTILKYKDRI